MSYFTGNIAFTGEGKIKDIESPGLITEAVGDLSSDTLLDIVSSAMQRIGLKNVSKLSTVKILDPVFKQLHTIEFKGINPLRSGLFLPMRGYETYRPSQKDVSRAYEFFGELDYLYILEFEGGDEAEGDTSFNGRFFMGYNDQILAYRCR